MVNKARRLSGINTLAYMGIDPLTAPYLVVDTRIPTSDDRVGNQIGALWILEETDTVAARAFLLVRLQGGSTAGGATWFEIGAGGSGFVDTFVTDSGNAVPAANIINIIGGTSTNGVATNMNTRGSGNTVFVNLNNSIFQPDTNASGTEGMYSLGGATFMHNFGTQNTWLGEEAGNLTLTTASGNTGLGYHVLESLTTGDNNLGAGAFSLNAATLGAENIALGLNSMVSYVGDGADNNIAIGSRSLASVLQCNDNISIGADSMFSNASNSNDGRGSGNVAIGDRALFNMNPTAGNESQNNIALGSQSGFTFTNGNGNICLGRLSGGSMTGASSNNVAIGIAALNGSAVLNRSIAIGFGAAQINQSSDVIAIGASALTNQVSSTNLIGIGSNALSVTPGNLCIAIGTDSQRDNNAGANNQTLGHAAMKFCTSASNNVIIGTACWDIGVGTGNDNIVLGLNNLRNNTTGHDNLCLGNTILTNNTTGNFNIGMSESALALCTGSGNIAIGQLSLSTIVAANNNTALGDLAGSVLTGTDSNNILIGHNVTGVIGDNNTTRIGDTGAITRCFVGGIRGRTTGVADAIAVLIDSAHQLGTVSSSARFKDNIQDMGDASSDVMKLRPVTFHYKEDGDQKLQYGLIAEEVESVMPRLVAYDENGEVYTVRYNELPAILLNEIQKLERRISALESRSCACSH